VFNYMNIYHLWKCVALQSLNLIHMFLTVVGTQFSQLTYYLLYHVSAKHTPINNVYAAGL
jgi:hypothetical protein